MLVVKDGLGNATQSLFKPGNEEWLKLDAQGTLKWTLDIWACDVTYMVTEQNKNRALGHCTNLRKG
jgi:hypothetical protein